MKIDKSERFSKKKARNRKKVKKVKKNAFLAKINLTFAYLCGILYTKKNGRC